MSFYLKCCLWISFWNVTCEFLFEMWPVNLKKYNILKPFLPPFCRNFIAFIITMYTWFIEVCFHCSNFKFFGIVAYIARADVILLDHSGNSLLLKAILAVCTAMISQHIICNCFFPKVLCISFVPWPLSCLFFH